MTCKLEMMQRRVRLSTWQVPEQGLCELRNVRVATSFEAPGVLQHEERPSKVIKTVVYFKCFH